MGSKFTATGILKLAEGDHTDAGCMGLQLRVRKGKRGTAACCALAMPLPSRGRLEFSIG